MSNQDMQLEIMAEGGFDIQDEQEILDLVCGVDYFTPERIIILREKIEQDMDNPCTSCQFNESIDPHVLDHCHYHCKDSDVQPIELTLARVCNAGIAKVDSLLSPLFD